MIWADSSDYDVVVVGSGAGGMLAAIRAHDLGLRSIVIEKSDRYGGTSAVSGGAIWIPNNEFLGERDSAEKALGYLEQVTEGQVPAEKLRHYVETAPKMVQYLKQLGVDYYVHPFMSHPDYYPKAEGALAGGRTMFVKPMDGGELGDEFFRMRESYPEFKMLGKVTLDLAEGGAIMARAPGWRRVALKVLLKYRSDIRWRRKTPRDRRLAIGNALIGGLRKAMLSRGIPLALKTRLMDLLSEDGRVTGVCAEFEGQQIRVNAAKGVILASGGFEQSQEQRDSHFPQATQVRWSATPRDNNTGDILDAVRALGAASEFMAEAWWAPTVAVPVTQSPNWLRNQALFFERGYPHSLCVNRRGVRFVNEACSYHQFGKAMLKDQDSSGANLPCWIIFDRAFRDNYPLASLQPGWAQPDAKVPQDWFDSFLYRADTLAELAAKIALPQEAFLQTIKTFNAAALKGEDTEFGRGGNAYNQYFGDPGHKPNRNLGTVAQAPFYAVRIDLGDLGSKGGPKTDVDARVIREDGRAIPGLYAVGNCAGSVMGPAYPGAGSTLGAAMTFAYTAVANIARKNEGI